MNYRKKKFRFECTGCGACCTGGSDHYVETSARERKAIRRFLDITASWFRRRYLVNIDKHVVGIRLEPDGRCPFLGKDNRCSIYPVRPRQCRTYPWWPELIETRNGWIDEARRCEGINRGAVVPLATIERTLKREKKAAAKSG
ncbi:MAG: YkgJ family cysteine cluster protein [Gammaproteobacteria bacterium]|nr:YkgJ family cysteine cluster protein [Gammaproteobacteria bacterium]